MERRIDEMLSLGSTLFSCMGRVATARNPNRPLRLRRGSPARACEGARCRVWSAEGASTTRTRNPGDAERRGEPRIGRFDRASNSENGRTNPARTGWQELRNLFSKLKFGQKYSTKWHLTTWTDCENEPELLAITREGAIAVGMGSPALVDRESLTVLARCHSGRGWQPKPRGVRRSRHAKICEAGAWERGKRELHTVRSQSGSPGPVIDVDPRREL
jgi:hypothetical protein